MRKLNRLQVIGIAVVMALAIAVPIGIAQSRHAHGGPGQGMRGGDHMAGAEFRKLDLTDAQKAQMKQIRDGHSQSLSPLMDQIRAKRQEIRQASEIGTFNEALVTQKLSEIAPLEAKLMGERSKLHQEMLSVLTADQKAKLEQSRADRKAKWAEGRANKKNDK